MTINERTTARDLVVNSGPDHINLELGRLPEYQPGVLITILHFFLTQLRKKKNLSIDIQLKSKTIIDLIPDFYDFPHLIFLLLFDNSNRITFNSSPIDQIEVIKNLSIECLKIQDYLYSIELERIPTETKIPKKRVEELRKILFAKKSKSRLKNGFSFLIPCFDHLDSNGLNKTKYFYSGNKIKPVEDVELWVRRLFSFNKINLEIQGSGEYSSTHHISEIVKELFHNTEDWARTTFDKKQYYNPNFRACYLSLYLQDRLKKNVNIYDYTNIYLKQVFETDLNDLQLEIGLNHQLFSNKKISICEMSIVDSGPGMARRWEGKDYHDIDKKDEIGIVLRCFHKYITTDESGRMNLRGQGLSKVLNIIRNTGFIRVHSGNVLLLRNFLDKKLSENEIERGILEFEARNENVVEGTCITILYPILYDE